MKEIKEIIIKLFHILVGLFITAGILWIAIFIFKSILALVVILYLLLLLL